MFGTKTKNIWKLSILWGALFVFQTSVFSQTDSLSKVSDKPDTIYYRANATDTSAANTANTRVYKMHYTRVAIISSAVVPGLGQAYNRKYWKIPLIYGGGSLLVYSFNFYNFNYQRCKNALNDPAEQAKDPDLIKMTSSELKLNKDQYRRYRDLTIIGIGLLYVANIVDAMVDSYMTEYDVSKDLSLKVSPTIIQPSPYSYTASCGVKMSLKF